MIEPRKLFGGLGNRMFQMAYIYARARDGVIPDIYVQSEHWFEKYKTEIRDMYREGIISSNYVALHIRLGDYKGNPFYVDLIKDTDYYERAVALFPKAKFLVFCRDRQDEIEDISDRVACQDFLVEHLGLEGRYEMADWDNDEIQDFNQMAGCTKGKIIANSSFSWWAGYVGSGPVVAPKDWFTDGVMRISIPKEWELL